jgi:cytochrome P450 family 9
MHLIGSIVNFQTKSEKIFQNVWNNYIESSFLFCPLRIYGLYSLTTPTFVVRDPELIKQITIKDFDSFVNRDRSLNDDLDKLTGKMLFSLTDEKWRHMRNILSPIFTSSKMKMMFGILSECADEFVQHFEEKAKNGRAIVDCKESYSRFTVDGISTAVLGFKGDCVQNPDSKLFKFALTLNTPTFMQNMKILLFTFWKWLYIKLKLQVNTKETYDFFHNAIVKVMKERDEKGIFRPDVVQLLLQAKKGQLQAQDKEHEVNEKELANFAANIEYDVKAKNKSITNWTDEHYMSQGFLFFAAGFGTTNILLQVTSYFLAKNKDVQQELIEEIDSVLNELNGKPITFEVLHKMKFLDCVISEALRWWPPEAGRRMIFIIMKVFYKILYQLLCDNAIVITSLTLKMERK